MFTERVTYSTVYKLKSKSVVNALTVELDDSDNDVWSRVQNIPKFNASKSLHFIPHAVSTVYCKTSSVQAPVAVR